MEKSIINMPHRFIMKCDAISFEIKAANTPVFFKFESTFLNKVSRLRAAF